MIAKNEARVITRCLDSVRPLVDFVLVEDTGSSDGTQAVVAEWLERAKMPGAVIEEPWRDFAYNRSHALASLRGVPEVDYALMIDADDRLVLDRAADPATVKAQLREDVLAVSIRQGGTCYSRPQICSNRKPFRFRGVLHEFLQPPEGSAVSTGVAQGFHIISGRDGARGQNPAKYREDAALLERALLKETDPFLIARYRFYLAQSYRDCGEWEKALANYLARADLGGWMEEVYCSLHQAARLRDALKAPVEEVIGAYIRAAEAAPARAEALHDAARYCRRSARFEEGYRYARRALDIPPRDGLFVEAWIQDYGVLDELAVNAYWAGKYAESAAACDRLLGEGKLPRGQRERVRKNRLAAEQKLQALAAAEAQPFLTLLRAARAQAEVGARVDHVIAAFERASAADPARAEALYDAARFCRGKERFEEAYQFAARGLALPPPQDAPALEAWIYDYGLLDELSVGAFRTGRFGECLDACERLLREGRIPQQMRGRVLKNRELVLARLPPTDGPSTAGASASGSGRS